MNEKGILGAILAVGENFKYLVYGILAVVFVIIAALFVLFAFQLVVQVVLILVAVALIAGGFLVLEDDGRWVAIAIGIILLLFSLFAPRLGLLAFM